MLLAMSVLAIFLGIEVANKNWGMVSVLGFVLSLLVIIDGILYFGK